MNNLLWYFVFLVQLAVTNTSLAMASTTSVQVEVKEAISSGRYLLAVPAQTIPSNAHLSLSRDNKHIPAKYFAHLTWPQSTNSSENKFVRVLEIKLDPPPAIERRYQLTWKISEPNIQFKEIEKLKRQLGILEAHSNWSAQSLLLHPQDKGLFSDWYIYPQSRYAEYVTDVEYLTQNKYPLKYPGQWLFDRPQALYQLYTMSGQYKWKQVADFQSLYYQNHIDDAGFFAHRPKDIKYLNGRGLLFRYMLTLDGETRKTLKRMYQASLNWNPHYNLDRGFFTERHQASALGIALSYWEMTLDPKALLRVEQIVDATYKMTFNSSWPNKNCPQHTLSSHERKGR